MRDRSLDEFATGAGEREDRTEGGDGDESGDDGDRDGEEEARARDSDAEGTEVEDTDDEHAEGDGRDEGAADATPVEPIVPTAEWHTEGAACAACGATVERRWRGEAGAVCSDCKEW